MIRNKLAAVVDAFTSAGYEVTVRPTQARMDACAAAEYACLSKQFDLIVCAGGDGTLNEVVQGLMHSQQPLPLGYLPSGSTNDFAKGLRIPDDVEAAAEWILHSHPYHCDIGRFNSRYFLYIAAFGAFTATVYETPQNIKNALGHTAYVLNAIAQVANIRPLHLRIEYDDQVTEGDYLYGMVSNTASVGGLLKLKSFMLDDGSFEVMLIRKPERAMDLHRIVTSLLNIDEENLSDSLLQTINSAFENANYAVKKIAYLDDKIAKLTQTAEKTTLLIQDNEAPASFSPIDNTVSLPYDTENTSELSQIGEPQNSTN